MESYLTKFHQSSHRGTSVEPLLLYGAEFEKYCSKPYKAVKSFSMGLVKCWQCD